MHWEIPPLIIVIAIVGDIRHEERATRSQGEKKGVHVVHKQHIIEIRISVGI